MDFKERRKDKRYDEKRVRKITRVAFCILVAQIILWFPVYLFAGLWAAAVWACSMIASYGLFSSCGMQLNSIEKDKELRNENT